MRIVSMLALALMIGMAPLNAQATNKSEIGLRASTDAGSAADVAVDFVYGTLGLGLQISKLVTPHLGIRAGGSYFSLNHTFTQTDVEYNANLKLGAYSGLVDFYPGSRGTFHLTGGVISNQTKADATGVCSGTFDLNDRTYTCSQVGVLSGSVDFPSASPYVGLGFGTPAKGSRVHFVMDLGGIFGTPNLTLSATNPGNNATLAADIRAQRDKTQTDINKYLKIFPVVQSGLGIRF